MVVSRKLLQMARVVASEGGLIYHGRIDSERLFRMIAIHCRDRVF
ncbi:hypothetical protein CA54_44130 [Symmachiella macrocystis]|uniref:Uncharacterized protein n=1 Tax=Symmachiella macrocystis TaxID=2527985 RepID=A0A5C6BAQ8_9PLAN|nr:hypothetical protein CA54_44130 [Symmachiella macrocystis]